MPDRAKRAIHGNAIVAIHDPDEDSMFTNMNIITYGKEVNRENTEEFTKRVNKHLPKDNQVRVSMVERIQANYVDIPLDKVPAFCKAVTEDHPGMEQTEKGLMHQILCKTLPKEMHELIANPFKKTKDRYKRKLAELKEKEERRESMPKIYFDTDTGEKLEIIFKEDLGNRIRANYREKGDRHDRKKSFELDDFVNSINRKEIRVRAKPLIPGAPQSIYGIDSKVKGYGQITGLSLKR